MTTQQDMNFWTSCSNFEDALLMYLFTLNTKGLVSLKDVKKAYNQLLKDELRISTIQL